MAKRLCLSGPSCSSSDRTIDDDKNVGLEEDRLTGLQDGILETILSSLTMKEAARTSVLSRRWKDLWKYSTGPLEFEPSDGAIRQYLKGNRSSYLRDRMKLINSHLGVIPGSHQARTVDGLRISWHLGKEFERAVHKWVEFASNKNVKELELELSTLEGCYGFPSCCTLFPYGGGKQSYPQFGSLRAFRLKSVDVTDEVLEHFLDHCFLLEVLSVKGVSSLTNVSVTAGRAPNLKHLKINWCRQVERIEIFAQNLLSFSFGGEWIPILLTSVPRLRSVSLKGLFFSKFIVEFCSTSLFIETDSTRSLTSSFIETDSTRSLISCLSRLETLFVEMNPPAARVPSSVVDLRRLKRLQIAVPVNDYPLNVYWVVHLLRSTPQLEVLCFKFLKTVTYHQEQLLPSKLLQEELLNQMSYPFKYPCLKFIKFRKFNGCPADFGLAVHLLNRAVSLEEMVIDPCLISGESRSRIKRICRSIWSKNDDVVEARERAKLLAPKLRPESKLYVL